MSLFIHNFRRGVFPVLTAAVLWGTVGPAQALASTSMGAAALGGWRLLVGGVILGAFVAPRLAARRSLLRSGAVGPLLVCAGSTALYQAAFLYSVSRTGAALATVVALGTAPPATGLIARWTTGERLRPVWAISTIAAVAGCVLLLAPAGSGVDVLGVAADVLAGICYALYTVAAHRLSRSRSSRDATALSALSLLLGALPLLPWTMASAPGMADFKTLCLVLWLGVASTALPYALFTRGVGRIGASAVGTLSLAEPLAAAMLGVLLLREHLSPAAAIGCLLIVGGLAAACLPANARRPDRAIRAGEAQPAVAGSSRNS